MKDIDNIAKLIHNAVLEHIKKGTMTSSTRISKVSIRYKMKLDKNITPLIWEALKPLGYEIEERYIIPKKIQVEVSPASSVQVS